MRHEARHRKADRAFDRDFEDAPSGEGGSRAALYEGRMGRRHQQAVRMQAGRSGKRLVAPGRYLRPSFGALLARPRLVLASFVMLCLAFSLGLVYPAAQDCYVQMRAKDQAAAEYQVVVERNGELERRVASLQTDEGMEELAHESLGWVREGESAVSVLADGSSDIGSGSQDQASSVASGSVPAPETWYSPMLDVVFGYPAS